MREITDRGRVVEAIQNLALTAELFEEQNGKQKYAGDLEVIVQGRDYGNGKRVGPYVRLLAYDGGEEVMRQGEWGGNTFYITVEGALDVYVRDNTGPKKISQLAPGTVFGEMGLLAGIERNATVSVPANQTAVVLEIMRPALRLLRKLKTFGNILDETYRTHGTGRVLEDLALITGKPLSEPLAQELQRTARFLVYGKNHVLCQEDAPLDRLILIKSGWVRRSHGVPFHAASPEVVLGMDDTTGVDFLGGGNCLGLEGVTQPSRWKYRASVMARTEVLEIPLDQFSSDATLRKELAAMFSPLASAGSSLPLTLDSLPDLNALKAAEEEIATGIIDGTNVLVMDMDLCIRCGNCSLACHKVHGQSRLLRRGIQIERPATIGKKRLQHALVPQVCMHCADPECMTGCPTGSIFRDSRGQIDIDAPTCIGCFDCATQCPYDAITMVPRTAPAPPSGFASTLKRVFSFKVDRPAPPEASDDPVAIKCNLCEGTALNPPGAKRKAYSCEENCPTGALVRVDPIEYFNEIGPAKSFVFRDQNHAVGRNIHKSDPLARAWHIGGAAVTILSAIAIGWAITRYGYDQVLAGTWLTMRWLTGLVGLVGVAVVMSYPFRKQIYRRRAGALRYWMLAHVYVGVIAGVVLMFHSGPRTGGLVTSFLYVAFDLTIASGIIGLAAYYVAPRIMTRIEGEPLLVEDLEGRRKELRADTRTIVEKSDGWLKEEITDRVYPRFLSYGFLWRQIWRREELKALLAQARQEFKERTTRQTTDEERDLLISAVETAVTLRRVDALLTLHWLLRAWIPLHILASAVMLALLLVHIGQVVFFSVK
jgi:Fe-S-cluster-containing dehydrogenase component/CRP-like cAMP-binding protein